MTQQRIQSPRPRPWYCSDRLVDEYKSDLRDDGDFSMSKALRLLRAIIVNVGIIAISLVALVQQADPTIIGSLGLAILAGYNGIELADYGALLQAYLEVQGGESAGDDTDGGSR